MMLKKLMFMSAILIVLSTVLPNKGHAVTNGPEGDPFESRLQIWLQSAAKLNPNEIVSAHHQILHRISRFYANRRYRPAWVRLEGLSDQGAEVMNILRKLEGEALLDLNTHLHFIDQTLKDAVSMIEAGFSVPLDALVQVEVRLTQIILGQISPETMDGFARPRNQDGLDRNGIHRAHMMTLIDQLKKALEPADPESIHKPVPPKTEQYRRLKETLTWYQSIQQLGGWLHIPDGTKLKIGKMDPRVPLLRWRLVVTNDMPLTQLSSLTEFDGPLDLAVRHFQRRHGLTADGIVGSATLSALNTPVERRIDQIRLNMVRWRRMPDQLGDRYLMVNIPRFQLDVVENDEVVHSMRVIVGKEKHRTPELKSRMTYLELNPYWNIPQGIAKRDILPKIKADPQYLTRQKIEVFDSWNANASRLNAEHIDWQRYSEQYLPFRLRQSPTAVNALGKIKFMFPNGYSVYIHDTPSKSLFRREKRSFSSGCVRVEDPVTLANYLLKDQQRDRQRLHRHIDTFKRQVIVLKDPVPVYLVYLTAWADENGTPHFVNDLYERDPVLAIQPSSQETIKTQAGIDAINPDFLNKAL